ncbi:MAG: hypothetical protein R2882_15190 [Gemmatimonadales bacterium]
MVWGRIEMEVRQADTLPVVAAISGSQPCALANHDLRPVPAPRRPPGPRPAHGAARGKEDEHTIVLYRALDFDVGLESSFFSLRNLRQAR